MFAGHQCVSVSVVVGVTSSTHEVEPHFQAALLLLGNGGTQEEPLLQGRTWEPRGLTGERAGRTWQQPWIAFADSILAGKADLGSVWKKVRRIKQQFLILTCNTAAQSTPRPKAKRTLSRKVSLRPVTPTVSRWTVNNSDERWRLPSRTWCQMTVWRLTPH